VETCVPVPRPAEYAMEFCFDVVKDGYGWIFPKGNHLNVGLYALTPFASPKEALRGFCRERLGLAVTDTIYGHRIPFGGHAYVHREGDPLLVGDAAGLIDPLLGEGIYNATRSGQLAALAVQQLLAGKADPYARLIGEVTGDLASYWTHTQRFYRWLPRSYDQVTLPVVRQMLLRGFALGYTFRRMKRRLPWLLLLQPDSHTG